MIHILWTPNAIDDFDHIFLNLSQISQIHAEDFSDHVEEIIYSIQIHPRIGRVVPEINNPHIRERIFMKYRLIYFLKKENFIEILTIMHFSQKLKL